MLQRVPFGTGKRSSDMAKLKQIDTHPRLQLLRDVCMVLRDDAQAPRAKHNNAVNKLRSLLEKDPKIPEC